MGSTLVLYFPSLGNLSPCCRSRLATMEKVTVSRKDIQFSTEKLMIMRSPFVKKSRFSSARIYTFSVFCSISREKISLSIARLAFRRNLAPGALEEPFLPLFYVDTFAPIKWVFNAIKRIFKTLHNMIARLDTCPQINFPS